MRKSQISSVNVSPGLFNILGEKLRAFWRSNLSRKPRDMSGLSSKIRYDIGDNDIRPLADHGHDQTPLEAMLRRSI